MSVATAKSRPSTANKERPRRRGLSFEARMLAPALAVLAAVSIFPFIYIILMSLSRVGLIGRISLHWVGLDNWTRLFSDGAVWGSWVRSVVYFVLTVGLEMTLGVTVALAINELIRGRSVLTR